ncbi:GrpB family protein [Deinococcus metallilatus]|uniref:GrpB-like predicted nucleotidyltransferase (UPF0157 family) n=1 Tax=Deinococcus metallilatus TaxID=1211322 RepID=A0ABR6MSD8_9DEIO|nr:GrpB family protein [Deinococcus metallilatus]MBB5294862.1 GrpB-like predicted nucleotidyltransferase (UPF0157 family) [Deinococcus metallilatus]GMA16789.1 hypothetical protein GCM10025871_31200 [Deinococcus metallilatus]
MSYTKRIVIVPPDPTWPARFQTVARQLRDALGERVSGIHHIGSTSVSGLPAKDVLDVQLTVADLGTANDVLALLAALGLTLRPEVTADHLPPGLELPPADLAKRYAHRPGELHVHIREEGRFNQRYALLMRDFLRAVPAARDAYAEIKRQLARLQPADTEAYYAVKDPVMDLLIAGAEQWAARTDWHLPPADA